MNIRVANNGITTSDLPRHIMIAGDLVPTGRVEEELVAARSDTLWRDISTTLRSHLACIVNLESPLTSFGTPINKLGPNLHADPLCARGIRNAGIDTVSLANNHIMDMGTPGLVETIQSCQAVGLVTVGAGRNLTEASHTPILEFADSKIALIAIAENEFSIASPENAGARPLDPMRNYYEILTASKAADVIIVVLHGGNECYSLPSPMMQRTCRFLADIGADAIICHHSHFPSGYEIHNGSPIIYGTGNFLYDSHAIMQPHWHHGYMVSIQIKDKAISDILLLPYSQFLHRPGIELMIGEEAAGFERELLAWCRTIADEDALLRRWREYCGLRKHEYLTRLFSTSTISDLIWNHDLIPRRMLVKRVVNALSICRCQTHNEAMVEVLERILMRDQL